MNSTIGSGVLVALLAAAGVVGCAHQETTPRALAAARAECARAENGPAHRLQPVAVGDAEVALADAEAAYRDGDNLAELRATLAQRKAQLAESLAATEMAREKAHDLVAQRNLLLDVRTAEARVIAERNGQPLPPPAGAAEMQPQTQPAPATTTRAPGPTPQGGPQSDAPPKAH